MPSNHVSAALSDADQRAVLDAIKTIREKLPFLIDLSMAERKALPRMGDKTQAFVQRALELAIQNNGILPNSFDLEEYRRDVALLNAMGPVRTALAQLNELLDDTFVATGSDAYTSGLLVYHAAKLAGLGEGLDELVATMGRRFRRKAPAAVPAAE